MNSEITADVLVAANDHGDGKRIAFGIALDLPASVIVHAFAPRGTGHFFGGEGRCTGGGKGARAGTGEAARKQAKFPNHAAR